MTNEIHSNRKSRVAKLNTASTPKTSLGAKTDTSSSSSKDQVSEGQPAVLISNLHKYSHKWDQQAIYKSQYFIEFSIIDFSSLKKPGMWRAISAKSVPDIHSWKVPFFQQRELADPSSTFSTKSPKTRWKISGKKKVFGLDNLWSCKYFCHRMSSWSNQNWLTLMIFDSSSNQSRKILGSMFFKRREGRRQCVRICFFFNTTYWISVQDALDSSLADFVQPNPLSNLSNSIHHHPNPNAIVPDLIPQVLSPVLLIVIAHSFKEKYILYQTVPRIFLITTLHFPLYFTSCLVFNQPIFIIKHVLYQVTQSIIIYASNIR